MHQQRAERLRRKLSENAARRSREQYLLKLPADYRDYLSTCPTRLEEDLPAGSTLFFAEEHGLSYRNSQHRPPDYEYLQFAWAHQAVARAVACPETHDQAAAFFQPFGGNPVYEVSFGWVRTRLPVLWEFSPEVLVVVRQDFQAGIISSNYCGFLPEDWNPDEVVYELGLWGFGH